jgi:hypothetical protein
MRTLWHYHRPAMVTTGLLVAVLTLLCGSAFVIRTSAGGPAPVNNASHAIDLPNVSPAVPSGSSSGSATGGLASAVAQIAAAPAIAPAVSGHYPAISSEQVQQPDLYAKAFARELFTINYHNTTRAELLRWAQYESTPYQENAIPAAVRAKMLVFSLADPAGDDVAIPPVLPEGPWLSLAAQRGYTTVSDVKASVDPRWKSKIAAGYEPADPQTTWIDVSALITLHTMVAGHPGTSMSSMSMTVMLGTRLRGPGYAATGVLYYVTRTEH